MLSFAEKFTKERCTLSGGARPDPCSTYTQKRYYAETVCDIIHSPVFQVSVLEITFVKGALFFCLGLISDTCLYSVGVP